MEVKGRKRSGVVFFQAVYLAEVKSTLSSRKDQQLFLRRGSYIVQPAAGYIVHVVAKCLLIGSC